MAPPVRSWLSAATAVALLTLSGSAAAQSSAVVSSVATTTASIAAAETTVAASDSDAGIDYFTSETVQITDAVVDNITTVVNSTIADLFAFADNETLSARSTASCKVAPSDAAWPSTLVWNIFDLLLGGRLIKTVPSAAVCYKSWPQYNAAKCATVLDQWTNSTLHAADPTSIMSPYWEGLTCEPYGPSSGSCTVGGYPTYSVNVSTVAQVQLAVNFARNSNMRIVVKNTGHDFNGKSVGAYSLNIWTHNLKDKTYVKSYTSGSYTGPAVKFGSGTQAIELYSFAKAQGITVVGGEGMTVGVGGGFLQGGGHSPLSPIYGMAADQVLAAEIVTPDGRFVTASPSSNTDLFYAVRGGGGATFGVVTSWVVKAHPKTSVSVIPVISFFNTGSVTDANFWEAIRLYWSHFPTWAEAGIYHYVFIIPLSATEFMFLVEPIFAPGKTPAEVATYMQPWYTQLAALNISVSATATQYDNFYDAWYNNFPLEAVGHNNTRLASRLWPKNNLVDATLLNSTAAVIKESLVEYGNVFIGFCIKADDTQSVSSSAVNPAWRNTYLHALTSVSWTAGSSVAEILAVRNATTNGLMNKWRALSPGAGSYMSEGDPDEPDFQQAFYGTDNYNKLYTIKQKYDPTGTFYALTAVGSEDWKTYGDDGQHQQTNKLCKV